MRYLKIDAGLFNGQGLAASGDFDSHKDFITRIALKPYPLSRQVTLSAAVSYLNGGFIQNTRYVYSIGDNEFGKTFVVDSAASNKERIAPRKYYGADIQLKIKHKFGFTELRAEFITGTQTATAATSETPAFLLTGTEGYYIRNFRGAYFYLLQNIFNAHHQLVIKYDWYNPNTSIKSSDIGKTGTALNVTDLKYSTLGFGYINYFNENTKLVLWYDKVTNEKTLLPGYLKDVKDDVFTCRIQFRF